MSESPEHGLTIPPEQQAIRERCFHPSGTFVEFPMEDVEISIPARFEKIVRLYPDRLTVKMGIQAVTYEQLNRAANRVARAVMERRGDENELVAIFVERNLPAVAAILGVLK